MTSVIIVAAGRSTRMMQRSDAATLPRSTTASPPDKLFQSLGGRPVLAHSLIRVQNCAEVDEMVVVTRDARLREVRALAEKLKLTKLSGIVEGGAERQDSVWNGLQALDPAADIVAVHDGARPFFPSALMAQLIAVARQHGSAVVCTKVTDTIKETDSELRVRRTVDRAALRAVQTPQVFQTDLLKRAYARVREQKLIVTDEAAAAEVLGQAVQLVENPDPNPKITTPLDLDYAELLLRSPR